MSDNQSSKIELGSPAKKPHLQPVLGNNPTSHHSQPPVDKEPVGSRDTSSEESPVQQQVAPLRSNWETPIHPAAAPMSSDAAQMLTEDGKIDAGAVGTPRTQAEGEYHRLRPYAFPQGLRALPASTASKRPSMPHKLPLVQGFVHLKSRSQCREICIQRRNRAYELVHCAAGHEVEQSAEHSAADLFCAFAAFHGMNEWT